MPVVSAVLQTQRRPARILFRSATRGRSNGAHHLWQEQRVLCRSDREETAKPFSAGDERPLVWHRWMQSRLSILSELGHLQSARVGQTRGCSFSRADRTRSGTVRLPLGGVHV